MQPRNGSYSWFGPTLMDDRLAAPEEQEDFKRLWLAFMSGRVALALLLFMLQVFLLELAGGGSMLTVVLCGGYLAATLMVRIAPKPRRLGLTFDLRWLSSIGVDVLVFSILHLVQTGNINYSPLYAVPVLQAAMLGSLQLALGTAASVTLLMLAHSGWLISQGASDSTAHFIQTALTGSGVFLIAVLAHQLADRLAREQQLARRSQLAMRIQQQVNDLVIESLTDGILVVDARGIVHAANPAARQMLQSEHSPIAQTPFSLYDEPGWQALARLAEGACNGLDSNPQSDINIEHINQGARRLRVRTRLTTPQRDDTDVLCVMFLQDLREMQARLRNDKLASMGRMSAAVAHEIRNPLAAISQANALLEEETRDPQQRRLTRMIGQNALRLSKIVDDVLNLSRVGSHAPAFEPFGLDLNQSVERICSDWERQTASDGMLLLNLPPMALPVNFDPEHLRRVMVNLLDNARRHASHLPESIQVISQLNAQGQTVLEVWSDGAPLEQSVERHLFEPFFSSESRSSGLGLYICRELCEGHGATISYQRVRRQARQTLMDGNEFFIILQRPQAADGLPAAHGRSDLP